MEEKLIRSHDCKENEDTLEVKAERVKYGDSLRLEQYISLRLAGYTVRDTLRELGFSAKNPYNLPICRYGEIRIRELFINEALNGEALVKKFKNILTMKLELEEKVLEEALADEDFKKRLMALKGSKDNISDLAKIVRLLEGESTENVNLVSKEEYQYEFNRLKVLEDGNKEPTEDN